MTKQEIKEKIVNLPLLSKSEVIDLFKEDLTFLPKDLVLLKLKAFLLLFDGVELEEIKDKIFSSLNLKNKKIKGIIELLKTQKQEPIEEDLKEISIYLKESYINKDKINYEEIVNLVNQKFNIKTDNEILNERLKNIIISYLKDIRDDLETIDILSKNYKIGGGNLDVKLAREIVDFLKKYKFKPKIEIPRVKKKESEVLNKKDLVDVTVKHIDFSKIITKDKSKKVIDVRSKRIDIEKKEKELISPPSYNKDVKIHEIQEIKKTESFKQPKKILSTEEEFSKLTLEDLRKFQSPEKFFEDLLSQLNEKKEFSIESFRKAVSQWRKSELYRLYLSIVQEGLINKMSIKEVIDNRKKTGKEYLTESEINLLVDFNTKIS